MKELSYEQYGQIPASSNPPDACFIAGCGQSAPFAGDGNCSRGRYFVFPLRETRPNANHPPMVAAVGAATDENTSMNIDVLAQCSDPDNDALAVISASTPSHGASAIEARGTISYAPVQGYCGPDSFTYTISDGQATAMSTVMVSVNCSVLPINCWTVSAKEIEDCIQGLANGAFKPPAAEKKNAFADKLNLVGRQIADLDYRGAMKQLQNDLRIRTDGYLGGNPEDDWIIDSNAQIQVCGMIDELIANLEAQSAPPRVYPG
jgi:hypothetical protein